MSDTEDAMVIRFREDYRDPAGLQARLRAAGVPATVQTMREGHYPTEMTGSPGAGDGCISWDPALPKSDRRQVYSLFQPVKGGLRVNPSYLPEGAAIWIAFPPPEAASAGRFLRIAVAATESGPPQFIATDPTGQDR